MILISKYLVPKGYTGMTIFPFIFLKHRFNKDYRVLINHEGIHLKQQLEMLIIPFFIWYAFEFVVRFFQFKTWYLAYKNISFEREAYTNEKDLNYLQSRSLWNFIKYL